MYEDIPFAVRSALESAETAQIREREKWEARDKKSQLDFHTINKAQGFLCMEKRNEESGQFFQIFKSEIFR